MESTFTNLFFVATSVAFLLFVIRHFYTFKTSQGTYRFITYKWIGWYSQVSITGTSSKRFRRFMNRYNGLTTAMWCFMLLAIIMYLLKIAILK